MMSDLNARSGSATTEGSDIGELGFSAFAATLMAMLEFDAAGPLQPSTGLFDELDFDSFNALQALIAIETAAELNVPPEELPEIYTLGDAYEYYRYARRLAASS